jgi:hypothetical protein
MTNRNDDIISLLPLDFFLTAVKANSTPKSQKKERKNSKQTDFCWPLSVKVAVIFKSRERATVDATF